MTPKRFAGCGVVNWRLEYLDVVAQYFEVQLQSASRKGAKTFSSDHHHHRTLDWLRQQLQSTTFGSCRFQSLIQPELPAIKSFRVDETLQIDALPPGLDAPPSSLVSCVELLPR